MKHQRNFRKGSKILDRVYTTIGRITSKNHKTHEREEAK
jgi:hypothetical protein